MVKVTTFEDIETLFKKTNHYSLGSCFSLRELTLSRQTLIKLCVFRGIVDGCELRPLNYKEDVESVVKRHAGWAPALMNNGAANAISNMPSPMDKDTLVSIFKLS